VPPDPLIPTNSPFNYNVGINYESWTNGRPNRSISGDLDAVTQNFKLIRTYHDVWSGSSTPVLDGTQQEVINYIINPGNPGLQLVMGTQNSAVAQGGFGNPWTAGAMTSSTYTDQWVSMMVTAFGGGTTGVANMQKYVPAILLGNELDSNGPPTTDPAYPSYQGWINSAFTNLQTSLATAGLGSIAVSTTIANYPNVSINPSANPIAVNSTAYILNNWSASWNGGSPFVLFNQYTPAGTTAVPPPATTGEAETTNYQPVIDYFNLVQSEISAVKSGAELFVGETGYSTYWNTAPGGPGAGSQANVFNQIFTTWLGGEYSTYSKTVPLFVFDAFDQPVPNSDVVQQQYGIYNSNAQGLKTGIALPSWTSLPKNTQFGTAGHDTMVGGSGNDTFFSGTGNDTIEGGSGINTVVEPGKAGAYTMNTAAGSEVLTVRGKSATEGLDQLKNIQNVQFADETIAVSWVTKAASLSASQILKVVDLYTAGFNRAPDALGLDYYASLLADGATLSDVSRGFFTSIEAAPIYSFPNTTPTFVSLVYQNALGREPDVPGLDYWSKELDSGHLARSDFVTALIAGARNTADAPYVANKEAVGAHYALTQGLNDVALARAVAAAVDGTAGSVAAANAQTDAFAATAALPGSTELVTQITGIVP
jgi:hypothetical protein